MGKGIWGSAILVAAALALSAGNARADGNEAPELASTAKPSRENVQREQLKEVFEACARAGDLEALEPAAVPASGAGDKTSMRACVRQFHEDMRACLDQAGISGPASDPRPTWDAAAKDTYKACRQKALLLISSS